ncbi:hypothetical protein PIB30_006131, partial [Stylosanthes scabra]|nr:hypothetical protein [Stylosanthes scabra]
MKIPGSNGRVMEINIKYENIENFCHYCGFLEHEERNCDRFLKVFVDGKVVER